MNDAVFKRLEKRLGRLHAKLRLGIELDHEAQIFGQGITFFHIENWYSVHSVIRTTLRLLGLYWRGRKNAEQIQVRHNHIRMKRLPSRFDGFTLLHISDLHVDMNEGAMRRLTELLPDLTYDVCVLTMPIRPDGAQEHVAGELIVVDVVDFKAPGIDVAQQQIGFTGDTAEIADTRELPIEADSADGRGIGDRIVGAVVHLQAAGIGVAQQQVAFAEAAEVPDPGCYLDLPAKQIGDRGSRAAIWHMYQINSGHHLEQFTGNVSRTSIADQA